MRICSLPDARRAKPDSFPARELVIKWWNAEMDWLEEEYFTEQWDTGLEDLEDAYYAEQWDTEMAEPEEVYLAEPEDTYFTELSNDITEELKYQYHLFRILDQPDCVVRQRAFADYLQLRNMAGEMRFRQTTAKTGRRYCTGDRLDLCMNSAQAMHIGMRGTGARA